MLNADDRWAIADTLAWHGHLLDRGRLDRLEEIFTADTVYDMSQLGIGRFEGIETVRAAAGQMDTASMVHYVTNIVVTAVDEDGDQASVLSKGLMIMGEGRLNSVVHHDTVRRTEGGWRIAERVISPQHAGAH